MRSANKSKVMSILAAAIAATLGEKSVRSATLSLYYDNITEIAPDGTTIVQSFNYASVGGNYSAIPTTINIAVGDTFEFGIDAVVTNNINPDAGKLTGTIVGTKKTQFTQPSFLGLARLGIVVPSSDTSASELLPNISSPPFATFGAQPDYESTESINGTVGGSSLGPNDTISGSNAPVPVYKVSQLGDESPASSTGGDVGDRFNIFAGSGSVASNGAVGATALSQFGAAKASFASATDFFDSLTYIAVGTGTVTLSPGAVPASTSYWTNTQRGSATVASGYALAAFLNLGDVVGTLPSLVINIGPNPPTHPLLSLTAASDGIPTTYGSSQGTLTVAGTGAGYQLAQLTNLNVATGFVEADGFKSALDEEIFAMDVLVNGVQANAAQIGVLLNAIDGADGQAPPSSGLVAAATYAGLDVTHDASPFPGQYNLFLDAGFPPSADNFLGFDFSSADSNLVGYSVSAIAVIPEPMSMGVPILGGLGLLTRRPRRPKDLTPKL